MPVQEIKTFAFMLKTYRNHLSFVERLMESIHANNVEGIHTYIVVPYSDLSLFVQFESTNTSIVIEESIPTVFAETEIEGTRASYINQEISKLAFHRLNLSENYMCLDSDGVFLKPFRYSDFLTKNGEPYIVLIEDNEIRMDRDYYNRYWIGRNSSLKNVLRFLEMDENEVWLNCHNFQIFSSTVLRDFESNVLRKNGIEFLDLMKISAYEFSWYNYYRQSLGSPMKIREPYFKVFHTEYQLSLARLSDLNTEAISRGYFGVCLQSNFLGNEGPISLDENVLLTYARFLNYREVLSVLFRKLQLDFSRPKVTCYRIINKLKLGWALRYFKNMLAFIRSLRS
jgi:hypothetical protein